LADQHAQSTEDQERATAEALNSPEGQRSGADVDQGEDEGDQEGVADGTSRLEEGSRVIEDEVDTSPLLHHLEGGSENGAAQIGFGFPETALEAVGPAGEPAAAGDQVALVLLVGNDLSQLDLDILRLAGLTTETRESSSGLLNVSSLDEVSGRIGQKHQTTTEDQTPGELDGDRDAIIASISAVFGGINDDGGE
jgi:hypothetical protein